MASSIVTGTVEVNLRALAIPRNARATYSLSLCGHPIVRGVDYGTLLGTHALKKPLALRGRHHLTLNVREKGKIVKSVSIPVRIGKGAATGTRGVESIICRDVAGHPVRDLSQGATLEFNEISRRQISPRHHGVCSVRG